MTTYRLTLDEMERRYGNIWRFDTARYTVACWAEPEDPADSFSFPEDIEFARSDDPAHWFCAFVGVFEGANDDDAELIAHDCLGGCSYNSFQEFVSSHYFPSMVREAIRGARGVLALRREGVAA